MAILVCTSATPTRLFIYSIPGQKTSRDIDKLYRIYLYTTCRAAAKESIHVISTLTRLTRFDHDIIGTTAHVRPRLNSFKFKHLRSLPCIESQERVAVNSMAFTWCHSVECMSWSGACVIDVYRLRRRAACQCRRQHQNPSPSFHSFSFTFARRSTRLLSRP